MNEITLKPALTLVTPLEMSSLEITELTGKEHKHVIRDIRTMLDELEKDGPNLDHEKDGPDLDHLPDGPELNHLQGYREDKDERGYTACFYLNKELTYTLLTGYSVTLRNKVVKRWMALEKLHAPVNPIEFIDRSRIIYLGQEHDPSLAGMFYAAMVGRVYGSRKAAKKLGYQQGFVESVMRLSDSDLAKMGEKAQGSTTEMVADAMKLRAVGAPLQIEKW